MGPMVEDQSTSTDRRGLFGERPLAKDHQNSAKNKERISKRSSMEGCLRRGHWWRTDTRGLFGES